MKTALSLRSIGLVSVCFVGVFFMFGSGEKYSTPAKIMMPEGMHELRSFESSYKSVIDSFSPSQRLKYDQLRTKKEEIIYKQRDLEIQSELLPEVPKTYEDRKRKTEIILIEDIFRKQLIEIDDEMHKMVGEGQQSCFPKGTKIVMHDGSLKPIHEINKGDKVLIYNIANDEITYSTVNENYIDTNNHMYILNDSIHATAYERFLTKNGWKRMNQLSLTDVVFNGNSFIKVNSINKVKKDIEVYNLNINSTHNFFVTYKNDDEWFLVHNSGGGGGGGGGK